MSNVERVVYSPDGRHLASVGDGKVQIWDAATGKEALVLRGDPAHDLGVAFSPDGRRLVSVTIDAGLRVFDATTGKQLQSVAGVGSGFYGCGSLPNLASFTRGDPAKRNRHRFKTVRSCFLRDSM